MSTLEETFWDNFTRAFEYRPLACFECLNRGWVLETGKVRPCPRCLTTGMEQEEPDS